MTDPVAAMPSLHAGAALLVAAFLRPAASTQWRGALLAYVALMALALVYTGEHYAVDVVAGWLTAGIAAATRGRGRVTASPAGGRPAGPRWRP
jgi:membrane-associated phospholipid phosphatase